MNEKAVTSFDLEPNPFEQSFASTEKPLIERSALRQGIEGISALQDRRSPPLAAIGTDPRSPPIFPNTKPPAIHSPPILSPGGSRRLPPLGLSPNTSISGALQGQGSPGAFYLSLSKTGLTPNESNIRSGLTPNVVGVTPNLTTALPVQHNSSAIPAALTSSTGLTPGRFTPMLNSLLSIPAQPVFPMAPGTNVHGTVDATKDPGSNKSADSSKYSTILSVSNSSSHSLASTHSQLNLSTEPLERANNKSGISTSSNERANNLDAQAKGRSQNEMEHQNDNGVTTSKQPKKKRKTSTAKQKARGNPSELETPEEKSFENSADPADTDADRERKRKEFLERNRIAASRFRRRKKEYIKRIEADLDFYQEEYKDLTSCLATLTGVAPQSPGSVETPSLINSLKQALLAQNINSAMQVCNLLEHSVLKTNYVQRRGVNPREGSSRLEEMGDSDA